MVFNPRERSLGSDVCMQQGQDFAEAFGPTNEPGLSFCSELV